MSMCVMPGACGSPSGCHILAHDRHQASDLVGFGVGAGEHRELLHQARQRFA
jgi:hypothetical protein